MTADDDNAREKRAFTQALEMFSMALNSELGEADGAILRRLANSTHQHSTFVLLGNPPVWDKDAVVVTVTIQIGAIIPAAQIRAEVAAGKRSKVEA